MWSVKGGFILRYRNYAEVHVEERKPWNKKANEKKKRGRDSHAEQYRPSDRDRSVLREDGHRGVMKTLVFDDDTSFDLTLTSKK
jgi:hypothetical protein